MGGEKRWERRRERETGRGTSKTVIDGWGGKGREERRAGQAKISQQTFFLLADYGYDGNLAATEILAHIQAKPKIGEGALNNPCNFLSAC